jgi:hypothetical protein
VGYLGICHSLRFSGDVTIRDALARKAVEDIFNEGILDKARNSDEYEDIIQTRLYDVFTEGFPNWGPFLRKVIDLTTSLIDAEPYTDVQALTDAFAKFKVVDKTQDQRESFVEVLRSSGDEIVIITLPDIREAPTDVRESTAYYVNFIKSMLGIKDVNVRLRFDKKLGNVLKNPAPVQSMCDKLLAAQRSSSGQVGLRTIQYPSGFKGSLVGCICAQRVLKKYLGVFKKKSSKATNLQILRDAAKHAFGFQSPGADPYIMALILQTIALMTNEDRQYFPAAFYKACKDDNGVKSNEGILDRLGYSRLLPVPQKVKYVSQQRFETDKKGKPTKAIPLGKELLPRNQEFYASVKVLLPLIKQDNNVSLSDQMKNPETHLTDSSQLFFKDKAECVDAIGKAYAFSSCFAKGKTKKTKLVHVANEVGKSARLVDRRITEYQDAAGNTYSDYMNIRYPLRKFIEEFLHRHKSAPKRHRDEIVEDGKVDPSNQMEVEGESETDKNSQFQIVKKKKRQKKAKPKSPSTSTVARK